jgi:hypothetical protein
MSNDSPSRHITSRDIEILMSLDRCPLTVEQLLKLSQTFDSHPFTSPRSVQERLQKLCAAGWARRWRYATASRGASPHYYKLTLLGYRILHGENAQPVVRRQFLEIAVARHHHTMALSDFIVHTAVAADKCHHRIQGFYRENTLKLTVGDEFLFPDCAFQLVSPKGAQFNFFVELDNSTERVRSDKDTESWDRKIRLYDELQEKTFPRRFRVLVVTTRSLERLTHILESARDTARNPRRSLFYGVYLPEYLAQADAMVVPCFRDHRGKPVSLLPAASQPIKPPHFAPVEFHSTARVC